MENKIAIRSNTQILTIPEDLIQVRETWIKSKEDELDKAKQALIALSQTEASDRRIRRTRERINILKKVIRALKSGFIPIPRFDSAKLTFDMEELPVGVITAVSEARAQGLFDEFRLIQGRQADNRRGRYGRLNQRDPMVVGVVRTPEIPITFWRDAQGINHPQQVWSAEEHFLIAWWRPEDERMEEMF